MISLVYMMEVFASLTAKATYAYNGIRLAFDPEWAWRDGFRMEIGEFFNLVLSMLHLLRNVYYHLKNGPNLLKPTLHCHVSYL